MHLSTAKINRAFVLWTILTTLAVELLLASLFLFPKIQLDYKIGISLFATVPAFVITIIQLVRTQQTQRASFIKDFLTEFRKNNDLHTAHYELVYRFRDDIYVKVEELAKKHLNGRPKLDRTDKPFFDCFKPLQVSDVPGARFFYPAFFQYSLEEKKLDGLLDYFNTIGLYLYEGLVSIEDVVSLLGDYVAILADRKVIKEYLALCDAPGEWKYSGSVGASTPYEQLRFLLVSYERYNTEVRNRKRMIDLKRAIDQKREEIEAHKRELHRIE